MPFQTISFNSTQFKTLMSASIFILAWILLAAQSVSQSDDSPSIEQRVMAKIQKSGKGVILGIAAHGEDVSALTDRLLTEVESNRYYAPVFVTSEGLSFQQQLKQFGLAQDQLPAVIYFNQQGREISRSVKVRVISNAIYQTTHLRKSTGHSNTNNTEYLVALSQALSTL